LARKNSNARPDDIAAAVEEAEALDGRNLLTGAPAPGATTDAYLKWLRENGLGASTATQTPRERMNDFYRMAERRRLKATRTLDKHLTDLEFTTAIGAWKTGPGRMAHWRFPADAPEKARALLNGKGK
jgi:hypothetical protein